MKLEVLEKQIVEYLEHHAFSMSYNAHQIVATFGAPELRCGILSIHGNVMSLEHISCADCYYFSSYHSSYIEMADCITTLQRAPYNLHLKSMV